MLTYEGFCAGTEEALVIFAKNLPPSTIGLAVSGTVCGRHEAVSGAEVKDDVKRLKKAEESTEGAAPCDKVEMSTSEAFCDATDDPLCSLG